MFNRKSIYALNKKDPNAIVYTDADGNLIRLTCDDFACAAEFRRWKDWSDSDLRKEENADHKQSDNSISLEVLSEEATAVVSIEDEYMEQISADEAAVLVRLLRQGLSSHLIETIIKDFLNSIGSDKLYMDTPPELEGLSNRK